MLTPITHNFIWLMEKTKVNSHIICVNTRLTPMDIQAIIEGTFLWNDLILKRLADFFTISVNELLGLKPLPHRSRWTYKPNTKNWRKIPLLTTADLQDHPEWLRSLPPPTAKHFFLTEALGGERVFAVTVKPIHFPRLIVANTVTTVVDPDRLTHESELVLAWNTDLQQPVVYYYHCNNDHIMLQPNSRKPISVVWDNNIVLLGSVLETYISGTWSKVR